MTADTEKALLEFVAAMAQWTMTGAKTLGEYQPLARAYLATLEPKPEPKRGPLNTLRDALRLYREERERVENVIAWMRADAANLRAPGGTWSTTRHVEAYNRERWADELAGKERRDG